ncbi:EF-hand domain-containing family member C2 [Limanda limanda]|uniref:EF-hand domain-containing family member C2 n=1 Tax=Limanda limanda TaxID=27771 RepID=UPI0029C68ED7|nr:EF-hand domain-containing family member C2 [Limanda limanda]
MSLPFLPGTSNNKQLGKERFHKSQHFDYSNGLPLMVGSEKPGIGGELLLGQKFKPNWASLPRREGSDLASWVAYDKQVLSFTAYFEETVLGVQGEMNKVRECKIYYYLEDDTMQVVEPNLKYTALPQGTFIHRQRVPMPPPDEDQFFQAFHFNINQQMVLFSRTFTVTSCDPFTRNFLNHLGVILNEPGTVPEDPYSKLREQRTSPRSSPEPPPVPRPPRLMPPYNGFGSEEDSLSFCRGLLPKPPLKDFQKFMYKDRKVMTFHAKILTEDPIDSERLFVVSYYLIDDTINVYEPVQKNSGILGGRFLERVRVRKPGQELFTSDPPRYYEPQDLYVGASLFINNMNFRLLDADEYTFGYMEQNEQEFPQANVGTILSKLRSLPEEKLSEMRKLLTLSDPGDSGFISYESLRGLLEKLDCDLSEHEMLVLGRRFCVHQQPEQDGPLMLAVIQDFLIRKNFDAFSEMSSSLEYRDRQKTGRISTKETRSICKGSRLPLPENLLDGLLRMFTVGDEIDYVAFMSGINWRENRAPSVMPADTLKLLFVPSSSTTTLVPQSRIRFSSLLQHLTV